MIQDERNVSLLFFFDKLQSVLPYCFSFPTKLGNLYFSMNDAYLCLGSPSGNITIYYTENGRVAKTLECSRNGRRLRQCAIRSAMFSNNSRYIAHSGPEGMLFRWDFVDPEYVKLFDNHKK
eukprot:TRINITY_DN6348_c0_g1_i3.p1 TRINITY_DN6348_c0_g1~~TRINITY_DN6348_c0_g1_i3.p1  ORF type:complete len:121 (+),score=14.46 TRINITY_DN6348_c0_g1_i3:569-931(+)